MDARIVAHRGAYKEFDLPENSRASLKKVMDISSTYNIGAVECDIRLSADNKVVVMHDATTGRTCDSNYEVATTNYVNGLDNVYLSNSTETVPLFTDFLDEVAKDDFKMKFMIEIKLTAVVPYALDIIFSDKYKETVPNKCEWITFYSDMASIVYERYKAESDKARVNEGDPDKYPCPDMALSSSSNTEAYSRIQTCLDNHYNTLMGCSMSEDTVSEALKKGLMVQGWTPNSKATMLDFMSKKVTSVLTDYPVAMRGWVNECKAEQE